MGRRHKEDTSIEEPVSNAVERVEAESVEEEQEGPMIPFLFIGFPQGFLTGCIMYLSHYSLMIGHWKIALGMAGMWVLLMLNYEGVILQRKERYPLWKVIGLCLVEGWIIEAAGSSIDVSSLCLRPMSHSSSPLSFVLPSFLTL